MAAESAVKIIYSDEIGKAEDQKAFIQEKSAAYDALQNSPESAAARGYVDTVILPAATRKRVIAAFDMLATKREPGMDKKHGNRIGEVTVMMKKIALIIFTLMTIIGCTACGQTQRDLGDVMKKAAMNTVMGMGTVFLVLILISIIIYFLGFIGKAGNKNKTVKCLRRRRKRK